MSKILRLRRWLDLWYEREYGDFELILRSGPTETLIGVGISVSPGLFTENGLTRDQVEVLIQKGELVIE